MAQVHKRLFATATSAPLSLVTSNKVIASNICTLTFGNSHGLAVGDVIWVRGVDAAIDGQRVVASVPNATTVTFAVPTATLASAAAAGSVWRLTNAGGKTASSFSALNGFATVTMTAAHGFAVGDQVFVNVGDAGIDGMAEVIAVPSNVSVIVTAASTTAVSSTSRAGAVGLMLAANPTGLVAVGEVPVGKSWLVSAVWMLPPVNGPKVPWMVWASGSASPGDADRLVPLARNDNTPQTAATGITLEAGMKVFAAVGGPRVTISGFGMEEAA